MVDDTVMPIKLDVLSLLGNLSGHAIVAAILLYNVWYAQPEQLKMFTETIVRVQQIHDKILQEERADRIRELSNNSEYRRIIFEHQQTVIKLLTDIIQKLDVDVELSRTCTDKVTRR